MANFSGLNTKEKENFGVTLTDSIKRAQSCNKAKKCTKKRDARAKLLFCLLLFCCFPLPLQNLTPCCCDPEILLPW